MIQRIKNRHTEGEGRAIRARLQFDDAKRTAESASLRLESLTPRKYTLSGNGWQVMLFPSNCRVSCVFGNAPRVNFAGKKWSILEVVSAFVIESMKAVK